MIKQKPAKEKLIREFGFMRDFEKWAGDFYRQVSVSPKIEEKAAGAFREIADDEDRHAAIIQKVLNIINNNL